MTLPIKENLWQRLIAGVNDTADKFISGVVDNAEQFIAGVVDIHSWSSQRIFEKVEMILMEYSVSDSWKKLKSKISCQTPFNARVIELMYLQIIDFNLRK